MRELAFWLRDLRAASGLTYAKLADRSGYSISSLQEAAAGRRLPSQALTLAFVGACDGDTAAWKDYWVQARRALEDEHTGEPMAVTPPWATALEATASEPPLEAPAARDHLPPPAAVAAPAVETQRSIRGLVAWRWPRILVVLAALAGVGLTIAAALRNSPVTAPPAFAAVVVQNKVAIGASELTEDKGPAYLSSEAIAFCSRRGCELSGTDMQSGAKLVVSCWTQGEEMTNEDATTPGIQRNPGAYSSDLWYKALWKDGRTGYISMVYIAPGYRTGMGLKECDGTP